MPSMGGGQRSSSQSGYSALPARLRAVFDPMGEAIGQYTNPNNPGVKEMFTPMGRTADETRAQDLIRQGFAPNAQSIQSDIAMQQNPFDQYVIGGINREANGQNSILQQNLTQAGQMGSNRGMLGANDIDLTRLQQIGGFQQSQFNNAMNNALNVLPAARAQDAQNLMGIGSFDRGLDMQTKQAPISALGAGTSMMAPFVTGGTQSSSSGGGLGSLLSGLGGAAMGIGALGGGFGLGKAAAAQPTWMNTFMGDTYGQFGW